MMMVSNRMTSKEIDRIDPRENSQRKARKWADSTHKEAEKVMA